METQTEGIREQSAKYSKVQNLMHNVNEETLMSEHRKQSRRKAAGVDGMSKDQYEENAEENIRELVQRMRKFQYKPKPVKRVYIPKTNGKQRPLGLPSYEDKLVQGVMANLLNDVYEVRFLDCSYGFRENRNAHDVVKLINQTIMRRKVNYVLEADIKGFFDNVDHNWLMKFLERQEFSEVYQKVSDKRDNGRNRTERERPRNATGRTYLACFGKCISALCT